MLFDYKNFKFLDFQVLHYNYDEDKKRLTIDCLYRQCEKVIMVFDRVRDYEKENILIGGMIYYIQYNKGEEQCDYEIVFRDTDTTVKAWADLLTYIQCSATIDIGQR